MPNSTFQQKATLNLLRLAETIKDITPNHTLLWKIQIVSITTVEKTIRYIEDFDRILSANASTGIIRSNSCEANIIHPPETGLSNFHIFSIYNDASAKIVHATEFVVGMRPTFDLSKHQSFRSTSPPCHLKRLRIHVRYAALILL